MPDNFDDRFSGLPIDALTAPLISDIVGNSQIASSQINLVPVDYDPFPKSARKRGLEAFNEEPPAEMVRPDAPLADKAFGLNDKERYQFFPERLARSVYDVMSGQVAPYNPSTGEYNVEGALDVAGLMGGAPLGIKPGTATLGSGAVRPIMNVNKNEVAPVFFSAVEKAVTDISQPKMTGQQWLGTLSNKPGVKPEELDWIGLKDYLKENSDKIVTKQEIESHVAANKVELKDVDKGKIEPTQDQLNRATEAIKKRFNTENPNSESVKVEAETLAQLENKKGFNPTKYEKWQLPGGENYREKLLTLPNEISAENKTTIAEANKLQRQAADQMAAWKHISEEKPNTDEARQAYANYFATRKQADVAIDKAVQLSKEAKANTYKSSHWDEPNILAHVRMNDRTIEGKKSLHIEEIQSDWHQQGRQQDYKGEKPNSPSNFVDFAATKGITKDEAKRIWNKTPNGDHPLLHEFTANLDRYEEDAMNYRNAVPDAPFKKTWHELALKRMLREAAEKGYDRLSWTPGEAQAARYDLSKQVEAIRAIKRSSDGNYMLQYRPKGDIKMDENSLIALHGTPVPENQLADFVGKDLAEKIIKQNGGLFKGLDLKIGGEGMKGFYDQIIPKALEKIGKEHGVKVKQGEIKVEDKGFASGSDVMDHLGIPEHKHSAYWNNLTQKERDDLFTKYRHRKEPIHYIDIPQSLKDQAMHKGFPLFSGGFMLNPVDHDPFKENK